MLKTVTAMSGPIHHAHLPLNAPVTPAISPQEFKDAMAKLAFSISIVTARHANEQLGRTVTSFMPLSAEPPHIMVSIDLRSRLIDLIGLSGRFSISFLAAGQERLGDVFAGKGPSEDRFSIADWDYWPSGTPKLANSLLCMDCELVGSLDAGDHMLFVGMVTETEIGGDRSPLLWNERAYLAPAR
ncbi:MAG: flavin reductase family protein [Shinella sp.]|nr:flavin reductase family protein [Shinella sp.]